MKNINRIAFIFQQGPHGNSAGREGLDALLAFSALTQDIALFFIADGVLHLLPKQQPEQILARDYIKTFALLPLYEITECYACYASLQQRGLALPKQPIIPVQLLKEEALRQKLADCSLILSF